MNVARALALLVTAVACVVVFLVMRYPGLRRSQFQGGQAFSVGVSLAFAAVLFLLFALVILRSQP